MKELVLEVETLEEPLHVRSPLGIRVNVDKICQDCELFYSLWTLGLWTCRSLISSVGWIGSQHTESA